MTALGLIETKGLVAAIEGADAMLKAAHVRLLEKNCVGGGLVTITVAGEVAAVKASVDAAAAAIGRIEGATLVSGHVIARPDAELARVIALKAPQGKPQAQAAPPAVPAAPAQPAKAAPAEAPKAAPAATAQAPAPQAQPAKAAPATQASSAKATQAPAAPSAKARRKPRK